VLNLDTRSRYPSWGIRPSMDLVDTVQVTHYSGLCELAVGDISFETFCYFFDSPQTLEFADSSGVCLLASQLLTS
jgi:hypothetical protein